MSNTEKERIRAELETYKLPWITKVFKKYGIPVLRYSFLPVLIVILIFGIIYNGSAPGVNDWMWTFDLVLALTYILGFGLVGVISKIFETITANKLRKKLGLSQTEFKILIEVYGITGM